MALPRGGLPLGYSFMVGSSTLPGPRQAVLHAGVPISYYLGTGPLDGVLVSDIYNSAWKGPQMTRAQAAAQPPFVVDPSLKRQIDFFAALSYIHDSDLLDWYTNQTGSRLYQTGAKGVDESSRIALAALREIENMADIVPVAGQRRNDNASVVHGGPDAVTPAGMVSQVRTVINRIQSGGPLPMDDYGSPNNLGAGFLSHDDQPLPGDTDPQVKTVWFYRFDHTAVDGSGVVTDAYAFCHYGFTVMVRDKDNNWHVFIDKEGESGFYRRNEDGTFTDVFGLGAFVDAEANTIIDAVIIILELVIDYYTGGSSMTLFAAVNPILFKFIKGALTGDTSEMFAALSSAAEAIVNLGAGQVAGSLEQFMKQSPSTFAFVLGDPNQKPPQPGVGGSLSNLYNTVAKQVGIARGFIDHTAEGGLSILDQVVKSGALGDLDSVGHGMVQNAFSIALNSNAFPAVTSSYLLTIRSTLGGSGSAGDYWLTLANDKLGDKMADLAKSVETIANPAQYEAQAKAAIAGAIEDLRGQHNVPEWAKNAFYAGAITATASAVQAGLFVANPTFRTYQGQNIAFQPGYVPPELKQALAKSGASLSTLGQKLAMSSPLSKLGNPTKKDVVAANANVAPDQIGPNMTTVAVFTAGGGTLAWLGKDALAKLLGKPEWAGYLAPAAALFVGGIAWYVTRFTVHGKPLTNAGAMKTAMGGALPASKPSGSSMMSAPALISGRMR